MQVNKLQKNSRTFYTESSSSNLLNDFQP